MAVIDIITNITFQTSVIGYVITLCTLHSVSSEDNCTDSLSPAAAKEPQTGAGTFELLLELPLGVFLALADLVSTACFALVELDLTDRVWGTLAAFHVSSYYRCLSKSQS